MRQQIALFAPALLVRELCDIVDLKDAKALLEESVWPCHALGGATSQQLECLLMARSRH